MEINTTYYQEILERFKQVFPWFADEIGNCRPKNLDSIRVTLKNGEKVDYNYKTDAVRRVTEIAQFSDDEVTDENCRAVFGANLIEMMKTRGFSQTELAKRTGLSTAIISKYQSGKAIPTITNLKKITRVLDCHYDDLLE